MRQRHRRTEIRAFSFNFCNSFINQIEIHFFFVSNLGFVRFIFIAFLLLRFAAALPVGRSFSVLLFDLLFGN